MPGDPVKRIAVLAGTLFVLLAAIIAVLSFGPGRAELPPPQFSRALPEGTQGIDVCSYQGEIDWEVVANSGIGFALLRIGYRGYSEGGLYIDEYFEKNFDGAVAAGLDVGVYFFSQALSDEEAKEEADFVLGILAGRPLGLPVCFDWEVAAEGRTGGAGNNLTSRADAFCKKIAQSGYTPCVYFNLRQLMSSYDFGRLSYCERWMAAYDFNPDISQLNMLQYSESGSVPGIDTPVDLNLRF
ncbi:MAG: glycoside hydrolase family 25 protein [Oscillospiraceae bacterium]|jgi:lysozyme